MQTQDHNGEWSAERLLKIKRLIRQLFEITTELGKEFGDRKFTPDGHLVGSIGEVVAAYAFGLTLLPGGHERHDGTAPDGTLVQIKLTGAERIALNSEPEHLLVLQLKNKSFVTIFNGPGDIVWQLCGKLQKNGQRPISISKLKLLDTAITTKKLPQVRDFPEL